MKLRPKYYSQRLFNANNQGRLDSKVIYGFNFYLELGNRNDDNVKLLLPCYLFLRGWFHGEMNRKILRSAFSSVHIKLRTSTVLFSDTLLKKAGISFASQN